MSRTGEIALPFGENEHTFRLGVEQWRKVQERCDAGPPEILARLGPLVRGLKAGLNFGQLLANGLLGTWRIDDIREVLLQGLVGGGMAPTMAGVLVRTHFDDKLSFEFAPLAYFIVERSLTGPEDEPLGETPAPEATTQPAPKPRRRSRGARSASPPSTAPGP